jgi:hypothetical protein
VRLTVARLPSRAQQYVYAYECWHGAAVELYPRAARLTAVVWEKDRAQANFCSSSLCSDGGAYFNRCSGAIEGDRVKSKSRVVSGEVFVKLPGAASRNAMRIPPRGGVRMRKR